MDEKVEKINFEDKIQLAKKHLDKLINPKVTLQDSVNIYKDGMNELDLAQKLLDEAKFEFQELTK